MLVATLLALQAFALGSSSFEGADGNLVKGSGTDWCNAMTNDVCTSTAPNFAPGFDKPSGSSDDSFAGGTKQDTVNPGISTGSIPPNKDDLIRFYVANEKVLGDEFVYLGWERNPTTGGSAHLGFEFNQNKCVTVGGVPQQGSVCDANNVTPQRSADDILIVYDFDGGTSVPKLAVMKWLTSLGSNDACETAKNAPCWGNRKSLSDFGHAEAGVNGTTSVLDPIPPDAPRTMQPATFGEAAVNLTAANIFAAGQCAGFGSAFLVSRSSGNSFQATLKDFIAPIPVAINNCGIVKIQKNDDAQPAAPLAGAVFTLYADNSGTKGASTGFTCSTGSDGKCTFSKSDGLGGTTTGVPFGTYWISETTVPNGYTGAADRQITLTSANSGTTYTFVNTRNPAKILLNKQDDAGAPLGGATFTLYTNVSNAKGVATSFTCTSLATASGSLNAGDCEITGILPAGTYWIVETTVPSGYTGAADRQVTVALGQTLDIRATPFVNVRQFKVIVLVCKVADNSLYSSKVAFDGAALPTSPNSLGSSASPTAAQLCALGGATHTGPKGGHTASVDIP